MNPFPQSPPRSARMLPTVILAAVLAACGSMPAEPDKSAAPPQAGCGACCDRDPSAEARATQGVSTAYPDNPYVGKDAYTNVVIEAGTVFYSLTPGATPRFAVTEQTLRDAGGSWRKYYELVQVTTDPGTDADGRPRKVREMVRAFHATGQLCVAQGIARANPQFGAGGGTQYYISPADAAKLRPGENMPISRWAVPENAGR